MDNRSLGRTEGSRWSWTPRRATPAQPANILRSAITGPQDATADRLRGLQSGVLPTPPADADSGLKVRRRYLDAQGKPLRGNVVHSGDLVLVELSVKSAGPLDHVVIEDLLPAGLEWRTPAC